MFDNLRESESERKEFEEAMGFGPTASVRPATAPRPASSGRAAHNSGSTPRARDPAPTGRVCTGNDVPAGDGPYQRLLAAYFAAGDGAPPPA